MINGSQSSQKPLLYNKRIELLVLIVIGIFSFGIRVHFILTTGGVTPSGDAGLYWQISNEFRNALCSAAHHCEASDSIQSTFSQSLYNTFLTRSGTMPLIFGALTSLSFDPPDLQSGYIIVALMDALVCVFLFIIMLRWEFPLWVATLAAVLQAIYIPAITSSGTFLQHNFVAFFLVLTIFAYTFAFTSTRKVWIWVILGTITTVVIGFSSLTTRPLLWIIPVLVLLLSIRHTNSSVIRKTQIICLVVFSISLYLISGLLIRLNNTSTIAENDIRSIVFTGLTTGGTASGQTTPMSFENIWPPDNWPILNVNQSVSIFYDFVHAPIEFSKRLGYSVWANWVYPDTIFFQRFIFDLDQLKIPHAIFVFIGFIGIAWLCATKSSYRPVIVLTVLVSLFLTLVYGLISIEPRRLGALIPFFAVGFANSTWIFTYLIRKRRIIPMWMIAIWLAFIGSLFISVSMIVAIISLAAFDAYVILTGIRLSLLGLSFVCLIKLWRAYYPNFSRTIAAAILSIGIAIIAVGSLQDTEWRNWNLQTEGTIRQQVYNFRYEKGETWPWLIIDVGDWRGANELTTDLSISVNGTVIKQQGIPMTIWSAGKPAIWEVYNFHLAVANFEIKPQYWYAVAVPTHYIDAKSTAPLTIEINSHTMPLTMSGDYLDEDPNIYIGPSFDPWRTGKSLFRWVWNATDPRIPARQNLEGVRYISAYRPDAISTQWITNDLSPLLGKQTGLFRIFMVAAPFSPVTNVLPQTPITPVTDAANSAAIGCLEGDLMSIRYPNFPFVCQELDKSIVYYAPNGERIGTSPIENYDNNVFSGSQIERIETKWGEIKVRRILEKTFLATMTSNTGQEYSVLFYNMPLEKITFSGPSSTFDLSTVGQIGFGWRSPESDLNGNIFRWSVNPTSSVEVDLNSSSDLMLDFKISSWLDDKIIDSLKLSINGQNIPLAFVTVEGGSRIYHAVIPREFLLNYPSRTRLVFKVDSMSEVNEQQLGFGLNWLRIHQP